MGMLQLPDNISGDKKEFQWLWDRDLETQAFAWYMRKHQQLRIYEISIAFQQHAIAMQVCCDTSYAQVECGGVDIMMIYIYMMCLGTRLHFGIS